MTVAPAQAGAQNPAYGPKTKFTFRAAAGRAGLPQAARGEFDLDSPTGL